MSLFDQYIAAMPDHERRAAGLAPGRVVPAPPRTYRRPSRFWARARLTLAVTAWTVACLVLMAAVIVGPAVVR